MCSELHMQAWVPIIREVLLSAVPLLFHTAKWSLKHTHVQWGCFFVFAVHRKRPVQSGSWREAETDSPVHRSRFSTSPLNCYPVLLPTGCLYRPQTSPDPFTLKSKSTPPLSLFSFKLKTTFKRVNGLHEKHPAWILATTKIKSTKHVENTACVSRSVSCLLLLCSICLSLPSVCAAIRRPRNRSPQDRYRGMNIPGPARARL